MNSERPPTPAPAVGSCVWCNAAISADAWVGFRRLRCSRCGAETTFPFPDEAELDAAYGGAYRPVSGRFSGPGDVLLRHGRGRLASRLDQIAPPGPILDVGAGDGALLKSLQAEGRVAVGTERSPAGSETGTGREGGGAWAGVVFWHSLEHLADAGRRVDALPAALLPNGIVVIAMPNPRSLQARAFGDRWLALDLPRHLVQVPADALLGRLSEVGLKVERVSYLRGGQVVFGWLHGLVGMLPGHPSLYDAIRRHEARSAPLGGIQRVVALALAAALLPIATALAIVEAATKRGGTVYVEARRA